MPYLDFKLGTDSLLVRFVGRIDYVVGRLPKADVQLRDMSVSRLHVQFFIDSRGQCFVRDLGSSGGTLVNDTPLAQNGMARLHDGSRIRIGQARVVFYDAAPPVNAVDPPGKSEPRGLIRLNFRKRVIPGGETVLAADKVSAQTSDGGPAESPPVVNSAEFSEDGKAIEDASVRAQQKPAPAAPAAPAAPKPPTAAVKPGSSAKNRDTGIMTAPWEDKRDFTRKPSGKQPTVPIPPKGSPALPGKPGAPASPAQAAKEAARQKNLPPAFESTAPEEDSRKTVYEPPLPPEQRAARVAPRPGALGGPKPPSAHIAKQPPPPAQPVSQLAQRPPSAPAQPPLPRGDSTTKRRTLAEEMLEDYEPKAAMPTIRMGEEGRKPQEPKPAPPPQPKPEPKPAVEPDLTTDEIAEYFGGEKASGTLKEVKFADTDPAQKSAEPAAEEVRFGPSSARFSAAADLDDEFDKPVEPTTSQMGAVTNLDESKVDEEPIRDTSPPEVMSLTVPPPSRRPEPPKTGPTAEEIEAEHKRKLEEVKRIALEAARGTAKVAQPAPAAPTAPVEKPAIMPGMPTEQVDKPAIMPGAPTEQVPKPAIMPGAPTEQVPKPAEAAPVAKSAAYPVALPAREKRETKKLAKGPSDPDTNKIKEFTIPVTDNPTQKIEGIAPGAKTLYIPKPDVVARQEERKPSKPSLESMAQGPGGDTLAVTSKEMMEELQQEYEKSQSKGKMASLQLAEEVRKEPVPVDKPAVDPNKTPPDMPVLPDAETVKKKDDKDEDMEFVLDDNYAFFTPPPPTRKDRKPQSDDLIDASEMLPPDKKAQDPPANEKTVSE